MSISIQLKSLTYISTVKAFSFNKKSLPSVMTDELPKLVPNLLEIVFQEDSLPCPLLRLVGRLRAMIRPVGSSSAELMGELSAPP